MTQIDGRTHTHMYILTPWASVGAKKKVENIKETENEEFSGAKQKGLLIFPPK